MRNILFRTLQTPTETTETKNEETESYLPGSIMAYGVEQTNGKEPLKAFCYLKDRNGNLPGAVMGYKTSNLFLIMHLYVEEQHRNNSHGHTFLERMENKPNRCINF